jgi:7-cyano-7-deazaguanine synthase in queuosine biosynthesis
VDALKTCLLSFSGGLDSLAAAIVLKDQGYDVTLGHIEWLIERTNFGEAQTDAALLLAGELGLPIEILATMQFPDISYAKYSWVPVCISTIMHHAGDPCVYPADKVRRFDSVAFGTDFLEVPEHDNRIRRWWLTAMQHYAYDGEVLYPLEGLERAERVALIPDRLRDMAVFCYLGPSAEEPCGVCFKCLLK